MISGACWSKPVCAEPRGGRRGGFTFIELLTVVVVIAILAAIAMPRLRSAVNAADAAAMVESGRQIMMAGVLALQENGRFPPDSPAGVVPPGLDSYLPAGFEFRYRDVATYQWSSESTPDGETAFLYIDY